MASTIELSTDDGPLPVYDAEPDGDARGAVVVIQEAFGVNDHIEDVARRFAAEGFRAVAPHLFHRSGDPDPRLRLLRGGQAAHGRPDV